MNKIDKYLNENNFIDYEASFIPKYKENKMKCCYNCQFETSSYDCESYCKNKKNIKIVEEEMQKFEKSIKPKYISEILVHPLGVCAEWKKQ